MRGPTIHPMRHDIDAAEKAAGLQSMFPPESEPDHGLWFAIGAGISAAAIAVTLAVT